MELHEALNNIQNLKGRYAAFEKLEEAIQALLDAEHNFGATRDALRLQIDKATADLKVVTEQLGERQEHLRATEQDIQKQDAEHEASHKKRLAEMEAEASARERDLLGEHNQQKNRLNDTIDSLEDHRQSLAHETDELEQKHKELVEAHEALKRKLA